MSLRALARFCYRRRRLVVGLWLAALVGDQRAVRRSSAPTSRRTSARPNTESTRAVEPADGELQGAVGRRRAGRDEGHAVDARPGGASAGEGVHRRARRRCRTSSSVSDPYTTPGAHLEVGHRSRWRTRSSTTRRRTSRTRSAQQMIKLAEQHSTPQLEVRLGGQLIQQSERPSLSGEGIGILAAIIILLIAFGSVLAMALPIVVALAGIAVGLPDHRPAHARLSAAELRDDAGDDDRHRRRHRLRAVRRHPLPPGTASRASIPKKPWSPRSTRRAGGAVRGPHRDHRVARHARDRPVVHQRARHRRGRGRRGHRARGGDAAARRARLRRHATSTSGGCRGCTTTATARARRSGTAGAGSCSATRGCSRSPASRIVLALALPGAVAAARLRRRRQRPAGHADARRPTTSLVEGIRPGLQRPVPARGRSCPPAATTRPSSTQLQRRDRGDAGRRVGRRPRSTNPAGTTAVIRVYPTTAPQDEATSTLLHHLAQRRDPARDRRDRHQGLRRRVHRAHRRLREPARPTAPAVHRRSSSS